MHRAVVVLLLSCVLGSVVATATPQETATANETAVRHVDPASAESDGDLGALESYLQRQLASRLARSQHQISQGQYQRGQSLVGDEYRDLLAKYVDVEGETRGRDESQLLNETGREQREFAEDVQRYRETLEAYREAKAAGDAQRARQLARELNARATAVQQTGGNLSQSYGRLGNASGLNLSDTRASVNATVSNVTAEQAELQAVEFTRTELTVRAASEALSFVDPLALEGRLETENGTALADRTITLRIANRSFPTTTDGDGAFTITYAPVRLRLATERLPIRYQPANESVYLGSNATVPVDPEQVTPEISVPTVTDRASFREQVTARTQVTVGDEPVPGARVGLFVRGRRLATDTTDADGDVQLSTPLPADVPTGAHTLTVRVLGRNRTVGPATANRTLDVRATDTDLSVSAEPGGDDVRLGGRLTTADGEPVAGRSVTIRRNDSLVTTVRTGADGRYATTVAAAPGRSYRFAAVYDEPSTNLRPTRARTSLALPADEDAGANITLPGDEDVQAVERTLARLLNESPLLVAGGLLVLVGLLVVAVVLWRRRGDTAPEATDAATAAATGDGDADRTDDASADTRTEPLTAAHAALDENANAAVEQAYRAVRAGLRDRDIGTADATHWEFYRAASDADVDAAALKRLTTAYERAAFDPREVEQADARQALTVAEELTQSATHD